MSEFEQKLFGIHAWRWQTFAAIATMLGIFTVVLGILQFLFEAESRRADKTLTVTTHWIEQAYDKDFAALRALTEATIASIPNDEIEAINQDPQLAENARRMVARQVLGEPGAMARFERIVFYFNFLGLCVQENLCSRDVARTFFAETALRFHQMFASQIDMRRQSYATYAEGLTVLVGLADDLTPTPLLPSP